MSYKIIFDEEARIHLRQMSARERRIVVDRIESVLSVRPTQSTRNQKELRPNPLARWELRVGNLRVFYDVKESEKAVVILAIGRKEGNRLYIGGREQWL